MHLTIPIETTPAILYTSIHGTHYRTTGLPVLEYYVDNTRHQTTILYLTSLHFIINLHLHFYLVYLHVLVSYLLAIY
jgi:hypothetical protein